MKPFLFSVIIPVTKINNYLRHETIPALLAQNYPNFEIIIVTDQTSADIFPKTKIIPSWPLQGPASKRNLAAKHAQGEILAFLDDDSYPDKNWLLHAQQCFKDTQAAGVCGPTLTPPSDNLYQQASGWVWATWLGSGGAGTYRCTPSKARYVNDYPSVNLMIRKKDFVLAKGFNIQYWPGEDTKLCHDLTQLLHKKIYYHPSVVVYHHRRPVFHKHLAQIIRYASHRGYFARVYPKTSFTPGYWTPSLFLLFIIFGFALGIYNSIFHKFYLSTITFYGLLLAITGIYVFFKTQKPLLALLLMPSIIITHLAYGYYFLKGFFLANLQDKR